MDANQEVVQESEKKELTKKQVMDVCIELNRKNASLMRDNLCFHKKLSDMKKVLDHTKVMYLSQKEQNDGLRAEIKLVEKLQNDVKMIRSMLMHDKKRKFGENGRRENTKKFRKL
jgi:hypothetical protein